jgi:Holliday junction resolvasome RuvABC ATP-dependent DNA helicase subunit
VLFSVMEDFTLPTGEGVVQFPRITVVGATTDEGALPDAFVNRFPLRPRFEPYTEDDMREIAALGATLGMKLPARRPAMFARRAEGPARGEQLRVNAARARPIRLLTPTGVRRSPTI